jgi:hypothetical protein
MSVQIQLRRGTALQWSTVNPILAIGEMALELDSHQFKLGNGVDHWNDLPYGGIAGSSGNPLKVEMITVTPLMITNGDVTNTVANQLREVTYDLTDTTGKINSVSVSPGDLLKVIIQRVAPAGTADTSDVRMISGSTEVSFNG